MRTGAFRIQVQEETVYSEIYKKEHLKWNTICSLVDNCHVEGVQICFDPIENVLLASKPPMWASCVGRFGLPFTTNKSNVCFWDSVQAKYAKHDRVIDALSHGLILDGDAAKILCDRGYGKYMGVSVGDDITNGSNLRYDLLAREVICDNFVV